ncbi:hypothetical protein PHLGIDRAFT_243962 [Phlebiopsis gigantea 11061_1 CR5-6]|uniref:Uncharacterized protein n=1 Tax=Phlebiopsis gigantea (strain 11061_1 CR5-6) TaxID=745531 RepID=A0A0C3S1V0_PHLG1|nr:hypothetical protein PHLGIDRAFT_243962 [Phlebiopsis gigantea 11061_1 CR5-6]
MNTPSHSAERLLLCGTRYTTSGPCHCVTGSWSALDGSWSLGRSLLRFTRLTLRCLHAMIPGMTLSVTSFLQCIIFSITRAYALSQSKATATVIAALQAVAISVDIYYFTQATYGRAEGFLHVCIAFDATPRGMQTAKLRRHGVLHACGPTRPPHRMAVHAVCMPRTAQHTSSARGRWHDVYVKVSTVQRYRLLHDLSFDSDRQGLHHSRENATRAEPGHLRPGADIHGQIYAELARGRLSGYGRYNGDASGVPGALTRRWRRREWYIDKLVQHRAQPCEGHLHPSPCGSSGIIPPLM